MRHPNKAKQSKEHKKIKYKKREGIELLVQSNISRFKDYYNQCVHFTNGMIMFINNNSNGEYSKSELYMYNARYLRRALNIDSMKSKVRNAMNHVESLVSQQKDKYLINEDQKEQYQNFKKRANKVLAYDIVKTIFDN